MRQQHDRILGIDASNIRAGGGVTHLVQWLRATTLPMDGVRKIVVWGQPEVLEMLPEHSWLEKIPAGRGYGGPLYRLFWQQVILPRMIRAAGCHVLFSPGGSLPVRTGVPCVTMSQNMLPFEPSERKRYSWRHWMRWKLLLLRWSQSRSFRRAHGVIFLTRYAQQQIRAMLPVKRGALIPHGVEPRFFIESREYRDTLDFFASRPCRVLYVSIVDLYKHQDRVAEAAARLRTRGLHVSVDFVGPAYPPALKRLRATLDRLDPQRLFLQHRGPMPFDQLHTAYAEADLFVFASSCENLPNILLEAMAARLPIACSNRGPMPEVLGDAGVYFDPERPDDIASAIEALYVDPAKRAELARVAQARARAYSWERCAQQTLVFIAAAATNECDS